MYEIIREDEGHAIGIRTDGPLTPDDLHTLSAYLDDVIRDHGVLRLLIEQPDPSGTEGSLEVTRSEVVERIAFVGAASAEPEDRPPLVRAFTEADVQYFDAAHLTEAWSWVRGKL